MLSGTRIMSSDVRKCVTHFLSSDDIVSSGHYYVELKISGRHLARKEDVCAGQGVSHFIPDTKHVGHYRGLFSHSFENSCFGPQIKSLYLN